MLLGMCSMKRDLNCANAFVPQPRGDAPVDQPAVGVYFDLQPIGPRKRDDSPKAPVEQRLTTGDHYLLKPHLRDLPDEGQLLLVG